MAMMWRGAPSGPPRPLKPGTVRRVVGTFAPYRKEVVLTAAAVLAAAALGLLSPFFLKIIVNRGLIGQDMGVVTRFTIYTLAATLGATAISLGYGYLSVLIGQHIMRDLRNNLFDHLQGMSLRFF